MAMVSGPAVAVEAASVPASPVETTFTDAPSSETRRTVTVVPCGTLLAARAIVTGATVLCTASGMVKLPDGIAGTATPRMVATRSVGAPAGGKRRTGEETERL